MQLKENGINQRSHRPQWVSVPVSFTLKLPAAAQTNDALSYLITLLHTLCRRHGRPLSLLTTFPPSLIGCSEYQPPVYRSPVADQLSLPLPHERSRHAEVLRTAQHSFDTSASSPRAPPQQLKLHVKATLKRAFLIGYLKRLCPSTRCGKAPVPLLSRRRRRRLTHTSYITTRSVVRRALMVISISYRMT